MHMTTIDIAIYIARVAFPYIRAFTPVISRVLLRIAGYIKSMVWNSETVKVTGRERKQIPNSVPVLGDLNKIPRYVSTYNTVYTTQWRTVGYIQNGQVINYNYVQSVPRLEHKMEYHEGASVKDLDVIEIKYTTGEPFSPPLTIYVDYDEGLLNQLSAGKHIKINRLFGETVSVQLVTEGVDNITYRSTKGMLALFTYAMFAVNGIGFLVVMVMVR